MDREADIMEEEGRAMDLATGRRAPAQGPSGKTAGEKPQVNIAGGILMLIFAFFIGDLFGSIPYLGVIFNLIASFSIYIWVKTNGLDRGKPWFVSWSPGLGGAAESVLNLFFAPLAAVFPTYAAIVFTVMILNTKTGHQFSKLVSPSL